jgi:hypothetical protein
LSFSPESQPTELFFRPLFYFGLRLFHTPFSSLSFLRLNDLCDASAAKTPVLMNFKNMRFHGGKRSRCLLVVPPIRLAQFDLSLKIIPFLPWQSDAFFR